LNVEAETESSHEENLLGLKASKKKISPLFPCRNRRVSKHRAERERERERESARIRIQIEQKVRIGGGR
jgi:hypothetical protein